MRIEFSIRNLFIAVTFLLLSTAPRLVYATYSPTCDLECITCMPIDTLIGDNCSSDPPGSAQGFHCTAVEHQIKWYGFIAGSEDLSLEFFASNCTGGSSLEILILEAIDCENYEVVSNCFGFTSAIPNNGSGVVSNTQPLVVGQYYFLVFDATTSGGCCEFEMHVTEGSIGAVPITEEPEISPVDDPCVDETITLSVDNEVFGAPEFNWYIDTTFIQSGETFDLTTSSPGPITICAEGASYCEVGPRSCVTINVNEHTSARDTVVICAPDCVDYQGQSYCDGGLYNVVISNVNGCDSLIDLTLHDVDISLGLETGECTENGVELLFDPEYLISPGASNNEIESWIWSINGVPYNGSENANPFYALFSGVYTVEYTIDLYGFNCTETIELDFDLSEFAYELFPTEFWADPCDGDTVIYSINEHDLVYPDQFTVFWVIPDDANIVSGQGSPDIEIDWTGSVGGNICYTVINPCITSDERCYSVEVVQNPIPAIISPDTICLGENALVIPDNIQDHYIAFDWYLDAEATLLMGDVTIPDSIELGFDQEGCYQVEIQVDYGCGLTTEMRTIEVVSDSDLDTPMCNVQGDTITLTWSEHEDHLNYNVNQWIGPIGELDSGMFQVTGLMPGDSVGIVLSADGFCNTLASDSILCILTACSPADLRFGMNPDTLCVDATAEILDYNVLEETGITDGIGIFGGTGIVDDTMGFFDPNIVGPGLHTITYDYSYQGGLCNITIDTTIFILEPSMLDINIDNDIVCVNESVDLHILGLDTFDSYTLSLDGGTVLSETGDLDIELSWSDPGLKTLDIEVINPYCGSVSRSLDIEVQLLPALNLVCGQSTSSEISFSWDTDAQYEAYEVYIDGDLASVIQSGVYVHSNLPSNTIYDIEIVPIASTSLCPVMAASIQCETNNCAFVQTQIANPSSIICGQAPFNPVNLALNYDPGQFDGSESVEWIGPNVNTTGAFDPNNLASGTYEIISVLNYYDCEYFDTTSIELDIVPTLALSGVSEVCIEDTYTIEYSGDDLTNYNYSWTGFPNGADITGLGPIEFEFDVPGSYTLSFMADNPNCVATPVSQEVMVWDSVRSPEIICAPGSDYIDLSWFVESSDCNGDFSIYLNGSLVSANQSETQYMIDGLNPNTDYTIEVVNNSACQCDSKATLVVCTTENCPLEDLQITSNNLVYCLDNEISNAQLNAMLNGSAWSQNLEWSGVGIDENGSINFDNILSAGVYSYQLIYTNGQCQYQAEIDIEIFEPVNPEISIDDPNCPESLTGFVQFENIDPNHNYYIDGIEVDPGIAHELDIGNHMVSLESNDVCLAHLDFTLVQPPNNTFSIDGPVVLPWGSSGIYNVVPDNVVDIDSIVWRHHGLRYTAITPELDFLQSSALCAEVYYNGGCVSELCIDVRVLSANVYIPNVMSKRPDSPNNRFKIFTNDEATFVESLKLFDRWGTLLFDQTDREYNHPDLEWDGSFRGNMLPDGVYVYVVDLVFSDGTKRKLVGDITLIE